MTLGARRTRSQRAHARNLLLGLVAVTSGSEVACSSRGGGPASGEAPTSAAAAATRAGGADAGAPPADARRAGALDGSDVHVSLPDVADAPTRIAARSGVAVLVSLVGATGAAAESLGDARLFRGGGPGGSDVVVRRTAGGVEDFVRFERAPASERVSYRVDVSGAAGLRLVGSVLELLDAGGAPRLRMNAPYVVDARGAWHDARVSLDDCAADTSTRAPWGRAVTAPGATTCTVNVEWGGGASIAYPAVMDPAWTTTSSDMTAARTRHTATLLANGRVLVAGGQGGATPTLRKSAELFDPTTGTFAATSDMGSTRAGHVAVRLSTGDVLVAGGDGDTGEMAASEVYDVAGGTFRPVGLMTSTRADAVAAALPSGKVLVAGGRSDVAPALDTAEEYDETTEQWKAAPDMASKRVEAVVAALPSGNVLVAGGRSSSSADVTTAQVYAAATGTWVARPGLPQSLHRGGAVAFGDGTVLLAGGRQQLAATTFGGSLTLDVNGTAWTDAGALGAARYAHTLSLLQNGAALAVGGLGATSSAFLASTELWDPSTRSWTTGPALPAGRAGHTATVLADGRVLVAGGEGASGALATALVLTLDADGTACTSGAQCASGHCADGVCCDAACDGLCEACAAASTGGTDGTCAAVTAGKDPRGDCPDDGAPACTRSGLCDGAGACATYPGPGCTPSPCTAGADCASGACADGVCCDRACDGDCEACTAAIKGAGGDGTCGPVAEGTDPDGDCGSLGTGVCKSQGLCDGQGACHAPTEGTACAAAGCKDAVTRTAAATCSASGACTPAETDCAPYRCDAGTAACTTTCKADADCAPLTRCSGGKCVRSSNGTPCQADGECTSGACADGVCCDRACDGQCEACDQGTNAGTCTAVEGEPRGGRPACSGQGTPCAGRCNGLFGAACIYPGGDTDCGAGAACTDGTELKDACDGAGACVTQTLATCAPYGCGSDACKTSCESDDDCSAGASCDASGACRKDGDTSCSETTTVELTDGGTRACAPYRCASGACTTGCETSDDCAPGASCAADGTCAAAPAADDGGCGCRVAGRAHDGGIATALSAIALAGALRRRRSRRS